MKSLNKAVFFIVSLSLFLGCEKKQEAITEDIHITNPEQSKVLFENEYVKAVKFSLKPGESLPMHRGGKRLVYSLSDYKLKWTENSAVRDKIWEKGDVHWHEAVPHAAENTGASEAVYLVITRKDASLPSAEGFDLSQDAGNLDPENSKLLFENPFMRLVEVKLNPGYVQPMHHGLNRLIYSLNSYQIKYTDGNGVSKNMNMNAGDVHWHTADKHSVQNAGDGSADYLIFTLKQ